MVHPPLGDTSDSVFRASRTILVVALICSAQVGADDEGAVEDGSGPDGKALVEAQCLQCHRADDARYPDHTYGWIFRKRFNRTGWGENVARMERIALRDGYIEEGEWSDADKEAMVEYLFEQTRPRPTELERIGQLHFSAVHFPIALLFVIGLFEVALLFSGRPMERNLLHALWVLAALSTALAVAFGYCLIWELPELSEDLADHRAAGLAALAWVVVGLALREVAVWKRTAWARWGARCVLLLAIVSAGFTGHLGGRLVHGEFLPSISEIRRAADPSSESSG